MANTDDKGVSFTVAHLTTLYPVAVLDIKRQLRCHGMDLYNRYQWFLQCKPTVTYHMGREKLRWSAWVSCVAEGTKYTSAMFDYNFHGILPANYVKRAKPIEKRVAKFRKAEILIEDVTDGVVG